jgi:cytochrome c551/c552
MSRPLRSWLYLAGLAVTALVLLTACGQPKVISPIEGEKLVTVPNLVGNPVKGKDLFTSSGCSACHTFTPAKATGTVGPDLNNLADYANKAGQDIESFTKSAITNPPAPYVPPQPNGKPYPNVMPTSFGTSLSQQDLADLVAFLTK